MSHPTPEDRALIAEMAGEIAKSMIAAVTPDFIKMIATARSDARVTAIGNLLSVEPMMAGTLEVLETPQQRDYRKECWIAAYIAGLAAPVPFADGCEALANDALAEFDKTFPS